MEQGADAFARRRYTRKLWIVTRLRAVTRPKSDLDLLIDVGPSISPWFPGGLDADLEEALGRRVDIVTERGLSPEVRARVLPEAVDVWRRTPLPPSRSRGNPPNRGEHRRESAAGEGRGG
jgi:uncharacterized protein